MKNKAHDKLLALGLALHTLFAGACAAPTVTAASPSRAEARPAPASEWRVPRGRAPLAPEVRAAEFDAAPTALAAQALGLPAGPIETCVDATAARGFYGLYADDETPKNDVSLTFDDGPHPTATPRVLDMLAERHLGATFFLIGRNINRDTYPLVQRMVADGHVLGSHSYSHDVHMTRVGAPSETVADIVAQHAATADLIDLAILARSGDDFDAMFREVFEADPATWLTASALRRDRKAIAARHRALLSKRGIAEGERAYATLLSRPPGGGPYVEHDGAAGIALYDRALAELGMVNVLWHGASGDTVPESRSDFAFLTRNLAKYSAHGGVILIHDYMRPDALAHGLDAMNRAGVRVSPLEARLQAKYRCGEGALTALLRGEAPRLVAGK